MYICSRDGARFCLGGISVRWIGARLEKAGPMIVLGGRDPRLQDSNLYHAYNLLRKSVILGGEPVSQSRSTRPQSYLESEEPADLHARL